MISKLGLPAIRNTHQENEAKNASKASLSVDKQGDTSRIEKLKDSITNGEYQLDLQALAKKIGEEIL